MIKHKKYNIKIEGNRQWLNGMLDETDGLRFLDKETTLEQHTLKNDPHVWEVINPPNVKNKS